MDITNIQTPNKGGKTTAPKINWGKSDILAALSAAGGQFGGFLDRQLGAVGKELNREVGTTSMGKEAAAAALRDKAAKKQLADAAALKAASAASANATSASQKAAKRRQEKPLATAAATAPKPSASGITKPAASSGSTGGGGSTGGTVDTGTTDTTPAVNPMDAIYAPLFQQIKNNKLALDNRYAQNQADIKSITGVLSAIAPQDKAKINEQFAQSIQSQSEALAKRTAEARTANAAGQAGAATAAAESGDGAMPVPTSSLSSQAAEQGIAQSNAAQTNWEGLMGAMQQQQLSNATNAQAGYGFEVADALNKLRNTYNADQLNLGNQELGLQSQQAQSQLSAQQAQAQLANDLAIAQGRNATTLGAAQIRASGAASNAATAANARILAAEIAAGAKGKNAAGTTVRDWEKQMREGGMSGADLTNLKRSVKDIESRIIKRRTTQTATGSTKVGKATPDDIYSAWLQENGKASPAYKDAVALAIKQGYYKYF